MFYPEGEIKGNIREDRMNGKLFAQAITKVLSGVLLIGILLFVPAGSFSYWNGWLLMAVLFVPMIVAGFVMMKKSPELLQKRLNAKEEQKVRFRVIPFIW